MSTEDKNENASTQTIVESDTTETGDKTLGELLKTDSQPAQVDDEKEDQPETTKDDSVPVAKFLAEKKARKAEAKARQELEARISELESVINDAVSDDDVDVASEVKELAKEYDIDPKFLKKLESTLQKRLDKSLEERLEPITRKSRDEEVNKVFKSHFDETIGAMPEYQEVVNPDVIKSLSLDPANAKLTLRQLIEKTYGNALGGKRTLESTVPNGGKEPQNVDYDKAQKDPEYFKRVMEDPEQKRKYNDEMMRRLQNSI